MAIKVPTYERQVQTATPRVANAPDIPRLDLSGGMSGVRAIGRANEELAETTQKISAVVAKHAQEQQAIKNKQIGQQVYTQYARDMQDRLFNPEMETVKVLAPGATKITVDGKNASNTAPAKPVFVDQTRPIGVMNRQLSQSGGSIQDMDSYYLGQARESYLSQIPDEDTRASVGMMMDTHYSTVRGNVISHESTQLRKDTVNTFTSSVKQQVADSYGAQDPMALSVAIDNASLTQDELNKVMGADEATSNLASQNTTANVVENSVMGKLKITGNVEEAQALLDTVKDKLSPENYDKLTGNIAKTGNNIQEQLKKTLATQKVATQLDLTMQVATGALKFDNSGQVIRTVMQTDPILAEAMQKSINSGDANVPVTEDNEAFQQNTLNIFKAGTREEIGNFVVKALNENGEGKISRERLAIVVDAANKRASNLRPDGTIAPQQVDIDAGYTSAYEWFKKHGDGDTGILNDYMANVRENKSPSESLQLAMTTAQIKKNPNRNKYVVGQIVTNGNRSGKVTGYDEDGEPLVELIK